MTNTRQGTGKLFRAVLASLITIALVVLAVILTNPPDDKQAQSAAESFIVAMQSDDPDRAYAMGNGAFRSATTEENLDQLFDQVRPFLYQARLDKADAYFATSNKGDPRAILVYTAKKDKHTTYIRIVMDKQGEKWLVHSLITKAQPLQAKPE